MKMKKILQFANELGASEVVRLEPTAGTPLGLMALAEQVRRLQERRPRGPGRPADPARTLPRIVMFRPGVWRRLGAMTQSRKRAGERNVSPAQLAAMLIEMSLDGGRGRS